MIYMTEEIEINTTSGGGISEEFKRVLTGQNEFTSDYIKATNPKDRRGRLVWFVWGQIFHPIF